MINLEQNYLVFFGLEDVKFGAFIAEIASQDAIAVIPPRKGRTEFELRVWVSSSGREGFSEALVGLRPASTTSLTTRLTSFLERFPCLGGYLTVLCFVCFAILITSLNMLRCITCLRRQPFRNNESVIIEDKIFNLQLKPLCNLRLRRYLTSNQK